jgi:hypothetical protein
MPDTVDGLGGGAARRMAVQQDRMALAQIVRDHRTCEATGERLDVASTVAMTVTVRPGVSRLAVVSAAHWDSGKGALSAADPDADPDVLDGRKLFTREDAGARRDGRERGQEPPSRRPGVAKPAQRLLRPASGHPGLTPRVW